MIHEKCEELFGIGRPLRVISQQQKDIRQIKRDYQKLEKRVAEVASKASRTIDVIVIDGNNLCYDDVGFIGLSALETLVPILNREHTIVIVFDSAIRRMLKTNDRGLQKSLGDDIQVHVVASGSVADETVLDLAAKNDHTYILSNDRFGDYNDKEVVRAGRIIRHEIVGGQVFVHDLNARCNYR
jgi:rRNA-processing protein FCF1